MMIPEDVKKLVIARLQMLPENVRVSIMPYGSFKRDELIEAVEAESELGKLIVEVELNALRYWRKHLFKIRNPRTDSALI